MSTFGDQPTTPMSPLDGLPPSSTSIGHSTGPDLVRGGIFAHFRLERELGRGGMGVVWFGRHLTLERPAAIKIRLAAHDDAVGRERFLREAKACAAVRHPHVVAIHDAGIEHSIEYLVMEFVAGGSLHDRMRACKTGLPTAEVIRVARDAASGLGAIHRARLLHRDIKPANLLIDAEGNTLLADFGLAKQVDASLDLTGGRIVGTPRFLAPEVIQGRPADIRSDLYALGATLYEALAATPIYAADTPLQLFHQITAGRITDLQIACPAAPPRLAALIHRLLARNPDERFADTTALLSALDLLTTTSGSAAAVSVVPPPSRRRIGLLVAGMAVTGGMVAALWAIPQPTPIVVPLSAARPAKMTTAVASPAPALLPAVSPQVPPVITPVSHPKPELAPPTVAAPVPEPPTPPIAPVTEPAKPVSQPVVVVSPQIDPPTPPPALTLIQGQIQTTQPETPTTSGLPLDTPVGGGLTLVSPLPFSPLPSSGGHLSIGSSAGESTSAPTPVAKPRPVACPGGDPFGGDLFATGWRQVGSQAMDGVFADGQRAVAWGTPGVMVSLDQGSTWSAPAPLWDGGPVPVTEAIFHGGQVWARGGDGTLRVSGENRAHNRQLQIGGATRLVGCSQNLAAIEDGGASVALIANGVTIGRASGQLVAVFSEGVVVVNSETMTWLGRQGSARIDRRPDQLGKPPLMCGFGGEFAYEDTGGIWEMRSGRPERTGRVQANLRCFGAGDGDNGFSFIGLVDDPARGIVPIGRRPGRNQSLSPLEIPEDMPPGLSALAACGPDRQATIRKRLIGVGSSGIHVYRCR